MKASAVKMEQMFKLIGGREGRVDTAEEKQGYGEAEGRAERCGSNRFAI